MSELGNLLRQARIEKEITLEDLEETTKIRKRYLTAIEEGEYKILPGNFYVRAFIKSYAEAVGLDPDEVIALYKNVIPAGPNPVIEPLRGKRRKSLSMVKLSKFASGFFMVAFLLLICGLIYYYFIYHTPSNQAARNDKPITTKQSAAVGSGTDNNPNGQLQSNSGKGTSKPDASGLDKPSQPAAPKPPAPKVTFVKTLQNGYDVYKATGSTSLTININASGNCWLEIFKRAGGKDSGYLAQNLSLQAGDKKTWTADQSVHIHVGNAKAVKISVNGQPIKTGDISNPKHFIIQLVPPAAANA